MPGPFTEGNPIDHTVSDGAGTVWPFASVQVNVHGGGAASLFSDAGRTVSVANPLTAGSDGAVRFFVAAGDYDFVATSETGAAHTVYVTVAQQVADTPVLQSSLTAQLAAYVLPYGNPAGIGNIKEAALNPLTYGVKADGATDDTAAWASITAAIPTNGGEILMPATGTPSIVKAPVYLPNKTVLRGSSRNGSVIQAAAGGTGFAGSGAVQFGKVADTQIFGTRLENIQVDANSVAPAAIYSNAAQELCGTRDVLAQNGTTYAVNLGAGCADCVFDGEFYVASAGTYAVYLNGCTGTVTIRGTASGGTVAAAAGIYALNVAGQVAAIGTHHEHATDGIVFDNSAGVVAGCSGPSVANTVTNLVHMKNNSRYVTVHGLFKGAATNAIQDDFFGKTITDSFIETAVLGTIWTARINHYGDQLGFYNATPVARPGATGITAGFTAGTGGTAVASNSTFTGSVGTTAYTLGDIVAALKNLGLIAS